MSFTMGVGSHAQADRDEAEGDARYHDWVESLSDEEHELFKEGKLSVGERLAEHNGNSTHSRS